MNNLDKQYQELLNEILEGGYNKKDRTGTGRRSVFGKQIRHKMSEGFPILTTKKLSFKTIVTELLWFLRGETTLDYLLENNCHIWDGDCYKNYCNHTSRNSSEYNKWMRQNSDGSLSMFTQKEFIDKIKSDKEFSKKWGDLGPIYGKQWRDLTKFQYEHGYIVGNNSVDQIQTLIDTLKSEPDSSRNRVSAWNVSELDQVILPACHTDFQVFTRELSFDERCEHAIKSGWLSPLGAFDFPETHHALNINKTPERAISLMWNQRSVDTFLGLPFNIASYGLLLELIAKEVNMIPEELIGNLADTHLYLNHIDQAVEQLHRPSHPLPSLKIESKESNLFTKTKDWTPKDFILENYAHEPELKAPLSN